MKNNKLPIIAAIDQLNIDEIIPYVKNELKDIDFLKIGLEIFNLGGRELVKNLEKQLAKNYFLDLKLHDIPNTVFQAIRSLQGLNPTFLTIHLNGGQDMALAALNARDQFLPDTKILGVTYLTSLDDDDFDQIWGRDKVSLFEASIKLAKASGIDGVVCSPLELPEINRLGGKNLIKVTPGIRPRGHAKTDQKRVLTPAEALKSGSDYLVIGRPLKSEDLRAQIIKEVKDFYFSQ